MLNHQSENPSTKFIMIDKGIDDELSPDAYYLLIKLVKLAPNEDNSTLALRAKTKFSKRIFDRAKAELISKNYLDTKQLYDNYYAFYIGKQSVQQYKTLYKKSNNRHEQTKIKKIEKSLDSLNTKLPKSRWSNIETV